MEDKKLNNLVTNYQADHSEEVFEAIYAMVTKSWRKLSTVAQSVQSDEAEILATYEDTLLNCIDSYDGRGDFINYLNRSIWQERRGIYRKTKTASKYKYDFTETPSDDGTAIPEYEKLADDYNLEEMALAKKKADQRQLIDFLLSGADATTTAIVEAALSDVSLGRKLKPTEIGKQLGIHHSIVSRKLERLAGKFDAKQFGSHRDYLVAL